LNLSNLSLNEVARNLKQKGLYLGIGAYTVHIHSALPGVAESLYLLYADYPFESNAQFADFHVSVTLPSNYRRWLHPQAIFRFDNHEPFHPLPADHGYALLEWGMNWCLSTQLHRYLIIHAAVIEKNGFAMIMPAPPGSGKSTLCAALVLRGWRLLSDELTLVSFSDATITPMCRPVSLKNDSIRIIHEFDKHAILNRPSYDTSKGTVAHMKAPKESVARSQECGTQKWIVFPKYQADAPAQLNDCAKAQAFMRVADNAFNYSMLGRLGFQTVGQLIEQCNCYEFSYSNLNEAIQLFDALAQQ
jgi:HprK-related kinase A